LSFEQLDEILLLLEKHKLSGIIATNTTLARDGLKTRIEEAGGLSGTPLKQKSLEILKHLNAQLNGRLPIISVGGISSGDDVQQRLDAGASLVQVYSGWIFEGPMMIKNMAREFLKNRV
jgi:dihydroorotate dehydrogenase